MAGNKLTPRQKMINMMYLVLTAMLALNVSSEVLGGFEIVNSGLLRTILSQKENNASQLEALDFYNKQNPIKVGPYYTQALALKAKSDSIVEMIEEFKVRMVKSVEGENCNPDYPVMQDNTDGVSLVMLTNKGGEHLKEAIYSYKQAVLTVVRDSVTTSFINANLNTDPREKKGIIVPWQQSLFGEVPLIAGVTVLNMIKGNVLTAQNFAYRALMKEIDQGDFRVNSIKAYFIPNSTNVIKGGKISGQIVLSAEDSTKRPNYYVSGAPLADNRGGYFERACSQVGEYNLEGRIDLKRGDGTISSYPFKQPYSVVEPTATVSATLMNLLYSRYDNPLSISVPGITANQITATTTNGTIRKNGQNWVIHPNDGSQTSVEVSAIIEGKMQVIAKVEFRLRKLPDPEPYIISGEEKVQNSIPRKDLLSANELGAGIYDGFLNVPYKVVSFTIREYQGGGLYRDLPSSGNSFSNEQKTFIRSLSRGASILIKNLRVDGPYGVETLNKGYEISIE